ncbi:hypothetical protein jhhlp_001216 [Lomentospora prolificans]|uniref:AMP-dependent synthetase/ligase domain-containing protein n=1 Tax=Lomentospora prolificans TaxID=41688 RepID=A0A2N3NHP7_9PEZI|nr:hypothetical protein jhhlp_001216 [Lomentospora prolificans]
MSNPPSRLKSILAHLMPGSTPAPDHVTPSAPHIHQLSPTFFLPRAAAIEPNAEAIFHITTNGRVLRRTYCEFADRTRGLAYYLLKHGFRRVGILAPNTPAFLESIYAIPAAGGVIVPVNYRLVPEDIAYIFGFAEVDCIIADKEYAPLLAEFAKTHPNVHVLIDLDTDNSAGELHGPFDQAVWEGLQYDRVHGQKGWEGLKAQCAAEDDVIAIPFTSGTTSRPKGVMYTHRGAYLAALANVVESNLNVDPGRCKYLWTLPMFHAVGWTFPWSVCAVRGTHVCLRKVDYPLIWKLLKEEGVTHFNAAPTVNTLLCSAKEAERLPKPVKVTVAASPPTAHLFEQMSNLNLIPRHVYGLTESYGPLTVSYELPDWEALPPKERFAKIARQGHGFITSLPARVVKTKSEEDADSIDPSEPQIAEDVLVDVKKDGKEIGEIVFFGNICAKGYYKDPEATKKLFLGGGLRTGDLAVWHTDGSIQILDRAKDIIISGGENISSVALESLLAEHPSILEVAVVAVQDSHWGERPKAYITAKDPANPPTQEEIITWAKGKTADPKAGKSGISGFMVPREVEVVNELPKTSTGKIRKNVLREWAKK